METQQLLSRIEAYCKTHHVKPSTFGRKVVNDGKLVKRLQDGKTITVSTFIRLEKFLSEEPA